MKPFTILSFFLLSITSFASHMRCGELTHRQINGNTYEITLSTYTKASSYQADRCAEYIFFGDGDSASVCRSNFEAGDPIMDAWGATCSGVPTCSTHHMGEWTLFATCLDIKKNIYTITHTFPGPGSYIISFWEFNRIDGVVNMSGQLPMYIADTIVISATTSGINSPNYINPPLDTAQIGICHTYNPLAVDPDGDSLSYLLTPCLEGPGTPVTGYFFPPGITFNDTTGDMTWCSPQALPPPYTTPYLYNFAIQIIKWRKINNNYVKIATAMRDIQIFVQACAGMGSNENDSALPRVTLFPNPTADLVQIQTINLNRKSYDLIGYDYTGKIVLIQNNIREENYLFRTSEFKSGLYLLQIVSEGKYISSVKLQVQK